MALMPYVVKAMAAFGRQEMLHGELNPRPHSEKESVRKNAVPALNHLALSGDIGRARWTG